MNKSLLYLTAAILLGLNGGAAFASSVTIPHSFTAGTPARASEVNDNFDEVATGINDNDSRITTNTNDIATNASDIATNTSDIALLQSNVSCSSDMVAVGSLLYG